MKLVISERQLRQHVQYQKLLKEEDGDDLRTKIINWMESGDSSHIYMAITAAKQNNIDISDLVDPEALLSFAKYHTKIDTSDPVMAISKVLSLTSVELDEYNPPVPLAWPLLKNLHTFSTGKLFLDSFPTPLLSMPWLKHIFINFTDIKSIPEGLSNFKNLQTFHMQDNNFKEFPLVLTKIPTLTLINLVDGSIGELPEELANLQNLKMLLLNNNPLRIENAKVLAKMPVGMVLARFSTQISKEEVKKLNPNLQVA